MIKYFVDLISSFSHAEWKFTLLNTCFYPNYWGISNFAVKIHRNETFLKITVFVTKIGLFLIRSINFCHQNWKLFVSNIWRFFLWNTFVSCLFFFPKNCIITFVNFTVKTARKKGFSSRVTKLKQEVPITHTETIVFSSKFALL